MDLPGITSKLFSGLELFEVNNDIDFATINVMYGRMFDAGIIIEHDLAPYMNV